MKLTWNKKALITQWLTAQYIKDNYGMKSAQKFLSQIHHLERLLLQNPNIAPIEPLLEGKAIEYRSIAVGDGINRIVYNIDGDFIKIVDIWDMRKSPENLQGRV